MLLALALAALSGCKSESEPAPQTPDAPAASTLTLTPSSAMPFTTLAVVVSDGTSLEGEPTATLGGARVPLRRLDASSFAVLVPQLAAGRHELVLASGQRQLRAQVDVTALPPIANPAAANEASLRDVQQKLLELETAGAGADPQLTADLAELRKRLDEAQQALATLSADEQRVVAQYLAANMGTFGANDLATLQGGTTAALGMAALSSGDGRCRDGAGNLLKTFEQCRVEFRTWVFQNIGLCTKLAAGLAVLGLAQESGLLADLSALLTAKPKVVIAIVGAGTVYFLMRHIQGGTNERFNDPVFGAVTEDEFYEQKRVASVRPALASLDFMDASPEPVPVLARYRSLSMEDAATEGAPMLRGAMDLEVWLDAIRENMFLSPLSSRIPQTPRTTVTDLVPLEYLSLGAVSPSDVQATVLEAETWMLSFTRQGLEGPQPFTFDVVYSPPGMPQQTRTRQATLHPFSCEPALALVPGDYQTDHYTSDERWIKTYSYTLQPDGYGLHTGVAQPGADAGSAPTYFEWDPPQPIEWFIEPVVYEEPRRNECRLEFGRSTSTDGETWRWEILGRVVLTDPPTPYVWAPFTVSGRVP